jgi:hypothetical protein
VHKTLSQTGWKSHPKLLGQFLQQSYVHFGKFNLHR